VEERWRKVREVATKARERILSVKVRAEKFLNGEKLFSNPIWIG
jgi:hypothetical protein